MQLERLDQNMAVAFSLELVRAVDEWRAQQIEPLPRSTAIRTLVRIGLEQEKKRQKTGFQQAPGFSDPINPT
jgi:hypothetical protein